MPQRVTLSWQSDMQLAGKLVLSAAALLLLTLAYRFYRTRSSAGGKIPLADAGEQRENASRDGDEVGDGDEGHGVRRRKGCGEEVRDGEDAQFRGGTRHATLRGDRSLPRGEEEKEEEEGEEVVSELGVRHRRVLLGPARRESELGSKLGCKLGIESESKPGIEPGSKLGNELRNELGSELASEPGGKLGCKSGNKLGIKLGSELRSKSGSKPESKLVVSKLGNESGSELASKPGIKLGNKSGSKQGIELGCRLGSEQGSNIESKLGNELGSRPESKLGSKVGNESGIASASEPGGKLGSELGNELGSELSSYGLGDVAETRRSHGEKGTLTPKTGLSPGIANAQIAGNGHAQKTEQGLAGGSTSRKAKGHRGAIQTLNVTSNLGLLMTASNERSDTSYSFSSVAKIQVEENYISKQQEKDGAKQTVPGLKGKVYDYYVQSISKSVLKRTRLPYIPPATSRRRSSEQLNEELQSFATQKENPTLATCDPTISSTVPPPTRSLETSPEPPSPGHKDSILQIADSPQLQLPMEGFGVTSPPRTPPTSPQPGLVANRDLFQKPPPTHLDLGNCYEVLCTAKAQKLSHLREAAYKVMSDNYLQVLRTPSIYGRLNAGERELILRQRMKGKMYMVVADVNVQEPGLHTGHLCYYDEGGDSWHHLCHMPPEVVSRGCAMCSMFNYLFVVAGCEGKGRIQRPSNRVFCYDPLTNIWREISPLNQARPHCKLIALDGHLYAIGGECLYTVERYDPRQDRWTFTAPLPHDTFAVAHTATVCDGEIYVTGGTLRYVLLRYDARLDSWRASPAIGSKDRTAEMVSTNGFIYRFDLHRSTGISVYRCSAKAKLWYECATYTLPDVSGFQCTVLGSLVHCIGRHFHIRFLADHISPRFGTKELQPFPSPHGRLLPLPAALVLPEGGTVQTQV
ncbi:PREDICTED: kelch domain-containing protein 7A-like [Acanthisitta chloris]|uniref:kelch domain-containing protein 7A-like n=1 Tax=Acanthisitta chloris TaxID=57068 RepID=UPI0004F0C923|nr:PREDICTED: kelch domain-containing protein 7A-like [Acanthisitta chloris]